MQRILKHYNYNRNVAVDVLSKNSGRTPYQLQVIYENFGHENADVIVIPSKYTRHIMHIDVRLHSNEMEFYYRSIPELKEDNKDKKIENIKMEYVHSINKTNDKIKKLTNEMYNKYDIKELVTDLSITYSDNRTLDSFLKNHYINVRENKVQAHLNNLYSPHLFDTSEPIDALFFYNYLVGRVLLLLRVLDNYLEYHH